MTIRYTKLHPAAVEPRYAHGSAEDAGMDICAVEGVTLYRNQPEMVHTGIAFELPSGYEMQIRPRSGLAMKCGVTISNAPGTGDPSYRGEYCVGLVFAWIPREIDPDRHVFHDPEQMRARTWNEMFGGRVKTKPDPRVFAPVGYRVKAGDRIAQVVLSRYEQADLVLADSLSNTARGDGGFGSSGMSA